MKNKAYIGDGVYAAVDNYGITLTTENGMCATNTIYLDNEFAEKLYKFLEEWLLDD